MQHEKRLKAVWTRGPLGPGSRRRSGIGNNFGGCSRRVQEVSCRRIMWTRSPAASKRGERAPHGRRANAIRACARESHKKPLMPANKRADGGKTSGGSTPGRSSHQPTDPSMEGGAGMDGRDPGRPAARAGATEGSMREGDGKRRERREKAARWQQSEWRPQRRGGYHTAAPKRSFCTRRLALIMGKYTLMRLQWRWGSGRRLIGRVLWPAEKSAAIARFMTPSSELVQLRNA